MKKGMSVVLDITKIPVYETPEIKANSEHLAQFSCAREGYSACATGVPFEGCPPYRDERLQVAWRIGWRWLDELEKAAYDISASNKGE